LKKIVTDDTIKDTVKLGE